MRYKTKLLVYFTSIFVAFAVVLTAFQYHREKEHRRELLEFRLRAYADVTANAISAVGLQKDSLELANLVKEFGKELRLTVITPDGKVNYETGPAQPALMDNHLGRPEVKAALKRGQGADIRHSETAGHDYFYYARAYDGFVVRAALPYDTSLSHFLRADAIFLWFVLLLFPLVLVALVYTSDRFGKSLDALRLFIRSAERGLVDYDHIRFPSSELGGIGRAIMKAYQRLEAANRDLERERARKQQMSNNITHELRTPVASIRGYLETVLEHPELPEAQRTHFLRKAEQQTERLTDLIRDVALITKTEEAPELLPREEMDVSALVADLIAELRPNLDAAAMGVDDRLPQALPFRGNYSLVYAIFRNLMENSIRYAGRGCRISIRGSAAPDGTLHFEFADNGRGVPAKHLPRLFERFYRVSEGRTRGDGGTGLGLSIVRNAVRAHRGHISVENAPGGGLCFRFSLAPSAAPPAAEAENAAPSGESPAPLAKKD